ncbi:MAG: MotA/TolQ/ExbB proton channel family protein [Chthoniobacteraceae bacterium]
MSAPAGAGTGDGTAPLRKAWKEEDPTNPDAKLTFGIGLGLTLVWFAIVYPMQAPAGKEVAAFTGAELLANLFYKHMLVSFTNTLFFCWAMAICFLKLKKLKHQQQALLLDVLPMRLGKEIDVRNVGPFIDHLYTLPVHLRDSLMVNRIRKALEFFEVRQNVGHVSAMMTAQSAIDGSRISGSYIILRAFLWAIPLLGFIGTVVGLSHAIGGMSFANVEDVSKIVGSLNAVTSGLGTAFDATLLGLVLAVLLNFPLNSLSKHEDETLNDIDAFCNEVLLPRLNDGTGTSAQSSVENIPQLVEQLAAGITASQKEFLSEFNNSAEIFRSLAGQLEQAAAVHQQKVEEQFSNTLNELTSKTSESIGAVSKQVAELTGKTGTAVEKSAESASLYLQGLSTGIRGLNEALSKLGEKQVVIKSVRTGWWPFGSKKSGNGE